MNKTPIISIKNLVKNYGTKQVLKGIDLDIYPGQIIGYIGPNGAGKSTTVKILIGLIPDFEGTVTINNIDLQSAPLEIKKIIGYVPENAELYEVLTPMEYLDFVGQLQGMDNAVITERAIKMLRYFNLEANKDQRMDTFSKGMRQKVLLISALIHNPQIIVLDEPLSGLDANAVILVKEIISLLAKEGKTIFYCSHMMDVVEKVSDRIVLINDGTIIANGTFDELQQNQGESLEKIFSKLTNKEHAEHSTSSFLNVFE
ncbi:MAG: ABC transporter ATP-binding protein [Candidatus Pedobacter colombiensis]|uniref:ABC transporter ATP-binding protein n=1 Tax=Candidatus Pedobacter colombiensis TaxID=3121371 RepID=A0AAJ5WB01_9SPHI|nr:ABC transporter ATP-binding protein [Pedobacter sp.]WEK21020.1 MAG: ABC transporter ATP-binding protein [Pedobacter sp.]